MRTPSWNIEYKMKFIGYYQLIGGIVGIIITLRLLIYESVLSGLATLLYGLALALFAFSIYSGNLLRKENSKGLSLSTWNQLLQIVQISIAAFGFEYYSGVLLNIGFDWSENFIPDMNLAISGWRFRYTESNTNNLSVYINIIPIIIIYSIGKIENLIEMRNQLLEEAQKNEAEIDD